MKIIQSIEAIYNEQQPLYEKLQKRVDKVLGDAKRNTWHYQSRIKQPESFALKLETGRVPDSEKLDDFFGCTIVVENLAQVSVAKNIIRDHITITSQKPKNTQFTHKEAYSFQFDDLRLYGHLIQPENLPPEPINKLIFEIQIKTFLQHAWTIATHDLIYKSGEINWPKQRIAYQIKAVLEQAEVAISGVDKLIDLKEVSKENHETVRQKKVLKFYKQYFKQIDLPEDLVRLCRNTIDLLNNLSLNIGDLKRSIDEEIKVGRGNIQKNLSPFLVVLQSLVNQESERVEIFLNSEIDQDYKLVLPKEIDISALSLKHERNMVKMPLIGNVKSNSQNADPE